MMKRNSRQDYISGKQRLEGLCDQKDLVSAIIGISIFLAVCLISYYIESGVNYE